jgi:hypothetical protein
MIPASQRGNALRRHGAAGLERPTSGGQSHSGSAIRPLLSAPDQPESRWQDWLLRVENTFFQRISVLVPQQLDGVVKEGDRTIEHRIHVVDDHPEFIV